MNRLSSGRLIQLADALQCGITDLIGESGTGSMKSTPFSRYAASKEGVAIINAMSKIPSLSVRRQIISLVESLSASIKL